MLDLLKRLFGDPHREPDAPPPPAGSGIVSVEGLGFDFAADARWHEDVPHPDWKAAEAWLETLPGTRRAHAWVQLERAWLDWLRGPLGLHYRLYESEVALLLTTQPERLAQVKLAYLGSTLKRIERVLEDIADHAPGGKEILIAFADEDDYYRYVSGFYPEDGTFGMSAGMHLGGGCGHFVTHGLELDKLEPTIVHEMTHSCVSHLRLPLWVDEGLAQAIERQFAPVARDPFAQVERLRKQGTLWSDGRIQEFWSGHAFHRPDDRQEMAYELALAMTETLAQDWPRYKAFVKQADRDDAGDAASRTHFGLALGEFARLFLEQPEGGRWEPAPPEWEAFDVEDGVSDEAEEDER